MSEVTELAQPSIKKSSASELIGIFAMTVGMIGFFGGIALGAFFQTRSSNYSYSFNAALMAAGWAVTGVCYWVIWLWSKAVAVSERTNDLLQQISDQLPNKGG